MKHLPTTVLLFTITIAGCNNNSTDNLKNTETKTTINTLNQKNINCFEELNNSKSSESDLPLTDTPNNKPTKLNNNSTVISNQYKYIITRNGIGDISLGQNFKPNEFREERNYLEGYKNCFFASSKNYINYQNILSFQIIDNIITGINIFNNEDFQTYTGVKVGDTTATIFDKHGRKPDDIIVDPYTEQPVFIYWTDSADDIGIRYDIEEGKVISISINFDTYIRYFEGCG